MPPRSLKTNSLKFIIVLSFTAFGCASKYMPVSVSSLPYYESKTASDTLRISYRYNVQELTDNKRYAAKEKHFGLSTVALKIENISPAPVTITRRNFKVSSPVGTKNVLSPEMYSSQVKQRVGVHMLHALWGPWGISYSTDTYGGTDVHGYYIPVGLFVGIGNAVRASNANKESRATLEVYEIWNKTIQPGKILYGLITIPSSGDEPLSFSYGKDVGVYAGGTDAEINSVAVSPRTKSVEHDFFVMPKEGKSYSTKTKIFTLDNGYYIMGKDVNNHTVMVYPKDTKTLSRMTADGKQLLGIPHDDYWLFQVISGRINAYHYLAEPDTKELAYLQKGDGELVTFSLQALMDLTDNDPDVIALARKGKFVEAIKRYNAKKL